MLPIVTKGGVELDKLKGKIVEKKLTYEKCAIFLGITKVTFVKKINCKTQFTLDEIRKIAQLLELSDDEKVNIFFDL